MFSGASGRTRRRERSTSGSGWLNFSGVSTLTEIEAAADALPPAEKQDLILFLAARLRDTGATLPPPRQFSREQVAAMARAWKVVYEKVPTPHASYTVDHTATVFLMTPAGRLKSVAKECSAR